MSRRPRCRDDLVFRQVGDEFLAYDPQADHLVLLSATAAAVLAQADGACSAGDIAASLLQSGTGRGAPEAVEADIERTLADLAAQGLLDAGRSDREG